MLNPCFPSTSDFLRQPISLQSTLLTFPFFSKVNFEFDPFRHHQVLLRLCLSLVFETQPLVYCCQLSPGFIAKSWFYKGAAKPWVDPNQFNVAISPKRSKFDFVSPKPRIWIFADLGCRFSKGFQWRAWSSFAARVWGKQRHHFNQKAAGGFRLGKDVLDVFHRGMFLLIFVCFRLP